MNASPKITKMTSREFNQHRGRAKEAASKGPVFITDRGEPAFVLMNIDEYRRIAGKPMSLLEALEQRGGPEYDFDIELPERRVEPVGVDFDTDE